MILSSCPAEICKKCGKPRERSRTEHHGHKMVAKEHQTIG